MQGQDSGSCDSITEDGIYRQLPFEFRILEIALTVVCNHLEEKVHDLERTAHPALEQLTKSISTRSLELVRTYGHIVKPESVCACAGNEYKHIWCRRLECRVYRKIRQILVGVDGGRDVIV